LLHAYGDSPFLSHDLSILGTVSWLTEIKLGQMGCLLTRDHSTFFLMQVEIGQVDPKVFIKKAIHRDILAALASGKSLAK
jgi:hypothetical protein